MKIPQQKTKIVATVGPACSSYDKLLELVKAGVDVFRLNFSHGSHDDHLQVIKSVMAIREAHNIHVSLLADLQGPKLRVGKIKDNALPIKTGDILTFTNEECLGTAEKIYMSYQRFPKDVNVGEKVLVDDGKIELEVVETNGVDTVKLKVLFGEVLSSNKGVNLPNTNVSLPALTKKDLRDLEFVLTQPFNWVALSFVRKADEIKDLKRRLKEAGHLAKVIAKIEKPEAIKNIKEIIKASNAIMVARGDLGIEVPMEMLPRIQKDIIRKCIQRARPVIVATQMMDSMITNPSPTRAEITDVANAVFDGADAVMLSGETSVGKHPVKTVEAMSKILEQAELHEGIYQRPIKVSNKSGTFISDATCVTASKTAEMVSAKAIVGMTITGYTAFKISSGRPKTPIYILSEERSVLSTLNLVWGVRCFYYDKFASTDETIFDVTEILKSNELVKRGDMIINCGSMPMHARKRTNFMKITVVD